MRFAQHEGQGAVLSRSTAELNVVVFLLVCLDIGGALYLIVQVYLEMQHMVFSILYAIVLLVLGVGLVRHTAWARAATVAQLWVGVLAVFGSLAPFDGDQVERYGGSLFLLIAIVVFSLALLLYSLHVLGKFKAEFYKKIF